MLEKIKYLTAGESHGKGLLGIIDGLPSNIEISEDYIKIQLSRRQMGHGRSNRMKIESDYPQLYCGVRQGESLGGPIGIIIENLDYKNWSEAMSISKNGSKRGPMDLKNPETGQRKSLEAVVFCSVNNSTNGGSKICNINNKIDHRYLVTWDAFANLTVYKFNFKKNQWCTGKTCRSWSEFN